METEHGRKWSVNYNHNHTSQAKMYRSLILLCSISAIKGFNEPRIIGGKSIGIEDAPYQASVYDGIHLRHMCGGSIIAPNYILTAAHCAYLPPQAYRVRIGSGKRHEDGDMYNVVAIFQHEDYHRDANGVPLNDIALMRVVPTISSNGRTVGMVRLPDKGEKFTGQNALLSGWGHTASGKASDQLQSLTVKILSREKCDENYSGSFKGIRNGQICAEHPDKDKDLCDGDSGGPLVVDGKQVGIVSWSGGPGCAIPGQPGVYTEVAAYRDWIAKYVRF